MPWVASRLDDKQAARRRKSQPTFPTAKALVLARLDKSPKGSLDTPILHLIHAINRADRYVTTSSCSGRIVLFEKASAPKSHGRFLLVSHDPVSCDACTVALDAASDGADVAFKCEPPILHVWCESIEAAVWLLQLSVRAGFRESGIGLSGSPKVMLAIRTTASALELPFGCGRELLLPQPYVSRLVELANSNLRANQAKTDRLLSELSAAAAADQGVGTAAGSNGVHPCEPGSSGSAVSVRS